MSGLVRLIHKAVNLSFTPFTLIRPRNMSTIRTGAAGVSLVSHRVQGQLKSDWQDVDAENDDAVDGIVFLRHRERFSGRMLFVQVKSGPSFKKESKSLGKKLIGVAIGRGYIEKHRLRWNALPGPVILAYVEDPDSTKSPIYWQDLRSDASYSKDNADLVVIPRKKTFGSEAKGPPRYARWRDQFPIAFPSRKSICVQRGHCLRLLVFP